MYRLDELLTRPSQLTATGRDEFFNLPSESHCGVGFWVSLAARARARQLTVDDLRIPPHRFGYPQALGIETALNQEDSYPFGRWRRGESYSPLVVIADRLAVDLATADVSGCIRTMFPEPELGLFVSDLCNVIGDLHDNVWSHGESAGISAAQRWAKMGTRRRESCIEFALADCGRGFLNELTRSGIARREGITDHRTAIEWCLVEGHSSKKRDDEDEWTQQLPEDAMGSPFVGPVRHAHTGNHHQGLGLHKLTTLVERYGGHLWIASGDTLLSIDASGRRTYVQAAVHWQGVTLACRFATDEVRNRATTLEPDDLDRSLLELMGGPS